MFGSAYFVGYTSTQLVLPPLADKYGRKTIWWAGISLNLIVMTVLLASKSYWLTVCCMLLLGMLSTVCVSIGYIYSHEFFPDAYKALYGTLWII